MSAAAVAWPMPPAPWTPVQDRTLDALEAAGLPGRKLSLVLAVLRRAHAGDGDSARLHSGALAAELGRTPGNVRRDLMKLCAWGVLERLGASGRRGAPSSYRVVRDVAAWCVRRPGRPQGRKSAPKTGSTFSETAPENRKQVPASAPSAEAQPASTRKQVSGAPILNGEETCIKRHTPGTPRHSCESGSTPGPEAKPDAPPAAPRGAPAAGQGAEPAGVCVSDGGESGSGVDWSGARGVPGPRVPRRRLKLHGITREELDTAEGLARIHRAMVLAGRATECIEGKRLAVLLTRVALRCGNNPPAILRRLIELPHAERSIEAGDRTATRLLWRKLGRKAARRAGAAPPPRMPAEARSEPAPAPSARGNAVAMLQELVRVKNEPWWRREATA